MKKFAVFGVFLTVMVWSEPLAACPEYMVVTCAARGEATVEKPARGWVNKPVRVFGSDGRLAWKGRVETYEPTGRVRVYDKNGDLVRNFRFLMPDYLEDR